MTVAKNPRQSNGNLRRKARARFKAMNAPCGICGGALGAIHYDEPSDHRHPLSFVIDEIHPVSRWEEFGYPSARAAAEDPANQQAAHYCCNAKKGDGTNGTRAKIIVVMGAPCSGKTSFVNENKSDADVVIDLDAIAYALGYSDTHGADGAILKTAFSARRAAINTARKQHCTCWIIHTQPNQKQLREYREMNAVFHLCDPGINERLRRAHKDGRPSGTDEVIRKWYGKQSSEQALEGNQKRMKREQDPISGTF